MNIFTVATTQILFTLLQVLFCFVFLDFFLIEDVVFSLSCCSGGAKGNMRYEIFAACVISKHKIYTHFFGGNWVFKVLLVYVEGYRKKRVRIYAIWSNL